jgi:hypothetical protein
LAKLPALVCHKFASQLILPVDLSMTELSAAIGQGKSPAGSNGPSPSHILKFIEEQKQKGGGGIEL